MRRPLLHPTRWPLIAGFVLVCVSMNETLIFFAALALTAGALPGVAASRTRTVQMAPALLGSIDLLTVIRPVLDGIPDFRALLIVVGCALVAVGGGITSAWIARERPVRRGEGSGAWHRADWAWYGRVIVSIVVGTAIAVVVTTSVFQDSRDVTAGFLGLGLAIAAASAFAFAVYVLVGAAGRIVSRMRSRSGPTWR